MFYLQERDGSIETEENERYDQLRQELQCREEVDARLPRERQQGAGDSDTVRIPAREGEEVSQRCGQDGHII